MSHNHHGGGLSTQAGGGGGLPPRRGGLQGRGGSGGRLPSSRRRVGLAGLEPSGIRVYGGGGASSRRLAGHGDAPSGFGGVAFDEPTGTRFSQATTYVKTAQFRSITEDAQVDGSYVALRHESILFQTPAIREVDETSALHVAATASGRPMVANNAEFFGLKQQELDAVLKQMRQWIMQRQHYREPDSEVRSWLGSLYRWIIGVQVRLFRLNGDAENRMRYTRGLQYFLHFLSGYESFLLAEMIRSHDSPTGAAAKKRIAAMKNRNATRVLVQQFGRYDRLYHFATQVTWNRLFDFLGVFPLVGGWTAFAATENFVGSKSLAVNSIVRRLFWEGSIVSRFLSDNRQALLTDNPLAYAQNLAAEGNGFETANRNQHGTYIGRRKTNAFRLEHRLPTDESIVRTFQTQPGPTMLNNGVEHTLRAVASHWQNMLFQENGNFGHQRMEQLNPFETLRFHMPVVLVTLSNLRGRNSKDSQILGPILHKLQGFDPSKFSVKSGGGGRGDVEYGQDPVTLSIEGACRKAEELVQELLQVVDMVCAGIPSRIEPLFKWLHAMQSSLLDLERDAKAVQELIASVGTGIRLGYQLIKVVNWKIPSEQHLENAVMAYMNPAVQGGGLTGTVDAICIERALDKLAPRDYRTLYDLLRMGRGEERPAKLLVTRAATLLQRELRRKALDDRIHELSRGSTVEEGSLTRNDWYWVKTSDSGFESVYRFKARTRDQKQLRFEDVTTNNTVYFERGGGSLQVRQYVPVAESISRAQKAFVTIELDHQKKFSYNAFMEFGSGEEDGSLRTQLRRLATLSQIQCYQIDESRRYVLSEHAGRPGDASTMAAGGNTDVRPQNLIVIGGGPTGLMTAIHCVQSVLMSGGKVTLYESRDGYKKEASTFERAQVVRLDSRWIAMLRYHLGTGYEDLFIPSSGETDAHRGNTIPLQGFVELSIKAMEDLLHDEAVQLRSRGLLNYYTGSGINIDMQQGKFSKTGEALKIGDKILLEDDERPWEVVDEIYPTPLSREQLVVGQEYDILKPRDESIKRYKLIDMIPEYDFYEFQEVMSSADSGSEPVTSAPPPIVQGPFSRFQLYKAGEASLSPVNIVLKCMTEDSTEQEILDYKDAKERIFFLDVRESHVLIAAGKPTNSDDHFQVTTSEPYGVCCVQGIKVSMVMHNFGVKRWDEGKFNTGLQDDIRSLSDQNTRLVGDFTKTVSLPPIIKQMANRLGVVSGDAQKDTDWARHLRDVVSKGGMNGPAVVHELQTSFKDLARLGKATEDRIIARSPATMGPTDTDGAPTTGFVRERLQTRYFETGDNFYLGMEFPREYEAWFYDIFDKLVPSVEDRYMDKQRSNLRFALKAQFDRLWFESTIEVMNLGDVFNPDGRRRLPDIHTIPSSSNQRLGDLAVGDPFNLAKDEQGLFSVRARDASLVQVRTPGGKEFFIPERTKAKLARNPSRVSTISEGEMQPFDPVDCFEVVTKMKETCLVRTSEGHICELPHDVLVRRESDLARGADGFSESKVALATFPVALKVNVRTMRILRTDGSDGYMTGFIGDAQASPHFMRYSGLTGACINAMSFNNFVAQAVAGIGFGDRLKRYALETGWSNGEVVTRGTGANYGEDGFCWPAFTYANLVNYLYNRVEEHFIIGEDIDTCLSRDWKAKVAAAIVPRGLENDATFRDALHNQLTQAVYRKFVQVATEFTDGDSLDTPTRETIKMAVNTITSRFSGGAEPMVGQDVFQSLDIAMAEAMHNISDIMQGVVEALKQSVDYSVELRLADARVSSELFHQPKSVDSLIDDFAVEAQNFANGLTQGVAFGSGATSFRLLPGMGANFISSLLGVWNIAVAFGTMTNVSRYRNRNEEARVIFYDEKWNKLLKGVFSLMSSDQQRDLNQVNPFIVELDKRASSFFQKAAYYDVQGDSVYKFRQAYNHLLRNIHTTSTVIRFIKLLLNRFIPEFFQGSPYLQAELVEMYKILNEMLHLMRQRDPGGKASGAPELYQTLLDFEPKLRDSLQRGRVRYGFLKDRPWHQWSIIVSIRYLLSCLCCLPTMSTATHRVLKKLELCSMNGQGNCLRREVRDFQELYYAGRESEITSMIFVTATIVFFSSIFFSLFRFIEFAGNEDNDAIMILIDITTYGFLASVMGASLALFHLGRKLVLLCGLSSLLEDGLVKTVTRTQQWLTIFRMSISIIASISLVWSAVIRIRENNGNGPVLGQNSMIPVWIAGIATVAAILATIFFFIVELGVRYNLNPNLGPVVCRPFIDELRRMKAKFRDPRAGGVGIETQQQIDREVWEYVAREFLHNFRFDTVFAADRFGSILQYLQSGAPDTQ